MELGDVFYDERGIAQVITPDEERIPDFSCRRTDRFGISLSGAYCDLDYEEAQQWLSLI